MALIEIDPAPEVRPAPESTNQVQSFQLVEQRGKGTIAPNAQRMGAQRDG